MEKIVFKKIKRKNIFVEGFHQMVENNTLEFSKQGITVVYGPNGTGKSSLASVLSGEEGTEIEFSYGEEMYTDGSPIFIINDQNSRNIIKGDEGDFLLGDNIEKEFGLRDELDKKYKELCDSSSKMLKDKYKISSAKSVGELCFGEWENVQSIVSQIANSKDKGKNLDKDTYILAMESIDIPAMEYDKDKLGYIINNISNKDSLLDKIEKIDITDIKSNEEVREVEENEVAIEIISRFKDKKECIICDSEILDMEKLKRKKEENKKRIIEALGVETQKLVESCFNESATSPFCLKEGLLKAIEEGDLQIILELQKEIKAYKSVFVKEMMRSLKELYEASRLKELNTQYEDLVNQKLEVTSEEFRFIEEVLLNSMNKELKLLRDNDKNIRMTLNGQQFISKERSELPLSAGEQNFLSLTFEFLKAKKSNKPIVLLDDPVSSFDSIYKNKIAFAIIKLLEDKKRIILTHNIDLMRLLEGQYKNCFKLYLFNNTDGEENGFISLSNKEQSMLINLEALLNVFRGDIYNYIEEHKLFLISLIPFMRGYATIIAEDKIKDDLTQLMHGNKSESIDIADIYKKLFPPVKSDFPDDFPDTLEVSIKEILETDFSNKEIIDKKKYPVLNRTLIHTGTYLFLRIFVEKELIEICKLSRNIKECAQLGEIIDKAFPKGEDGQNMEKRIFLTTKKTLLNEFNHFEGNMSIFQPAVDITDRILKEEKEKIEQFIQGLKDGDDKKTINP